MSEIDDGGPAFARPKSQFSAQVGMSLRDWFAGQALVGMNATLTDAASSPNLGTCKLMANYAYDQADAMLAARKVKP